MLGILEREIVWNFNFARRIVNRHLLRKSLFARSEHSDVRLTGKWDETLYASSDVNAFQEASSIMAFTDVSGTKGSFVQDIDGNVLLDLCGTEGHPLGHNHDALIAVRLYCRFLTLFLAV